MTAEIINIERAYILKAREERAAALAMKLLGRTEAMVEYKLRSSRLDACANRIASERSAARRRQENQRANDGTLFVAHPYAGTRGDSVIYDDIHPTQAGEKQ